MVARLAVAVSALAMVLWSSLVGPIQAEPQQHASPEAKQPATSAARVYVILWFDTEDYLLPASDDAAKRLANWLAAQGLSLIHISEPTRPY